MRSDPTRVFTTCSNDLPVSRENERIPERGECSTISTYQGESTIEAAKTVTLLASGQARQVNVGTPLRKLIPAT